MIILPEPNNNLWIYDDKEHKLFDYNINKSREKIIELIPQHDYKDFCHILAGKSNVEHVLPRKWTTQFGGYWDGNFDYLEIFNSLCVKKREIDNIFIYEMSWGEIFMIYEGADFGGYDVERRFKIFSNIGEYNENFYLV